ncbi:hypothetical protein ABVT39_026422 [Epinephelus coioides]
MMCDLEEVRRRVEESLAAAEEEILRCVEEEKLLQTSDVSAEQQRAAVHKRLSAVADEIFWILERMIREYEAEVSSSHEEIQRQRQLLDVMLKTETNVHRSDRRTLSGSDCEMDVSSEQSRSCSQVQKTSNLLQTKDASTETDCELIHGKASYLHQTQRAERGTSTVTETLPPRDHSLSSNNSEAASEDDDSDDEHLKSNKSKTFQSHREECCRMCGRSFPKSVAGRKIKKQDKKVPATNRSLTAGQSCCRVCGKFFRYKRSFLKHVLTHEQCSDLCGACGKHLGSDESLAAHLQTHNEENSCRDQTEDRQSEAEGSDAESKVDSDEWRDSEGSDSDDGDSEKEESKDGPKSKSKGSNKPKGPKNNDNKDLSNLKYRCKVCAKSFCYRASFLKHVLEDERDTDLCAFPSSKMRKLQLTSMRVLSVLLLTVSEFW